MKLYALLSLFFPFLGAVIAGFFGCIWPILSPRICQLITTSFVFLSMLLSFFLFKTIGFEGKTIEIFLFPWLILENMQVNFSLFFDTLTIVMMSIVTFVSAMVHLYSIGYMERDPGISRFMAYLSLFT